MKKLFTAVLIFASCVLSQAQTIGSASNITGTNYYPVLVSAGIYQTNQPFHGGAYKTITLGNITSTNETVTGYYVVNPTNGLVPAPGLPGYYIIGSFTNSFASGTNGGSWSTTFSGNGISVPEPLYLGLAITGGAFTNTAYAP
jgi:hypothetical protein